MFGTRHASCLASIRFGLGLVLMLPVTAKTLFSSVCPFPIISVMYCVLHAVASVILIRSYLDFYIAVKGL